MTDERPTHLDLFSGIGGFALAAQWAGFRTIGFCEIDEYCQRVLAKNFLAYAEGERESSKSSGTRERILQSAGSCSQSETVSESDALRRNGRQDNEGEAPAERERVTKIHPDIFTLNGTAYRGVSLITGGFPCQPFSVAGKRRGAADERALWPEMLRIIKEARPAWVLGENVPGIVPMELDNVLFDLESISYATRPFVIPACAVDARHRRDRVWIVAKSNAERCGRRENDEGKAAPERERDSQASALANADECTGERSVTQSDQRPMAGSNGASWCEWQPEPDVGRVAHGIPSRVDRLKGLGNAIVPQVAYEILREIRKLI